LGRKVFDIIGTFQVNIQRYLNIYKSFLRITCLTKKTRNSNCHCNSVIRTKVPDSAVFALIDVIAFSSYGEEDPAKSIDDKKCN
jgi:hypothetical protein